MNILEAICNASEHKPTDKELYDFVLKNLKKYPNRFLPFHLDWATKNEHYEIAAMLRDEMKLRKENDIFIAVTT